MHPIVKRAIALATVAGAGFIGSLSVGEGIRNIGYRDPGGRLDKPTACVGHTGPGVKEGVRYSDEQCAQWLKQDADNAAREAKRVIRPQLYAKLSPAERDSYSDFVFNKGLPNFQQSAMLRKLNAEDRVGACKEHRAWVYGRDKHGNKVKLGGLVKRAEKNAQECLAGVAGVQR